MVAETLESEVMEIILELLDRALGQGQSEAGETPECSVSSLRSRPDYVMEAGYSLYSKMTFHW